EADLGLEPLAMAVDQADRRDRGSAQARGEVDDAVEIRLPRRVQDLVGVQGRKPRGIVAGFALLSHRRALWSSICRAACPRTPLARRAGEAFALPNIGRDAAFRP